MAVQQDGEPAFSELVDSFGDGDDALVASLMNNAQPGGGAVANRQPLDQSPSGTAAPNLASLPTTTSPADPATYASDSNWGAFEGASPSADSFTFPEIYASPYSFQQPWAGGLPSQFFGQVPERAPSQQASPISLTDSTSNRLTEGQVRPNPPPEVLSTLTPAQQEKLKSIAMPAHLRYQSPRSDSSPQSSSGENHKDSPSSPDTADRHKLKGRKRKSSAEYDEDDDLDDDGQHPIKKTAHNMIEKRYRTNLNDKIAALRESVPSLRIMSKSARGEDTTEDREELHGLTPAHKLNKATVLSKATEYIRHLEKRNNRLMDENSAMQQRIGAFEKLFMHGALGQTNPISPLQQSPNPLQYPQDNAAFLATPLPTPGGADPPGLIQVPEEMKRIIQAQAAVGRPYPVPQQSFQANPALVRQQQIQQQQMQQNQNRWQQNAGPFFGKLMVGSLAGLMILEAVRENEQSNESPDGRGLSALPTQLFGSLISRPHFSVAGYEFATAQVVSTLKLVLLCGALLWAFLPSLFIPKPPKPQKSRQDSTALEAVPSLASPIHVRRQAWLTAIQTVWVPQHNFFLEAAALILKTMKLSLRNTIGIPRYQMLTGLTEEQETARVKAWAIALDAQLAGGDVEINGSRLTLTFLASWTLPNSPLRLMLKALHIRVLAQQLGHTAISKFMATECARAHWKAAQQLRAAEEQGRRGNTQTSDDDLPEHLAVLLDQDCDEVLLDDIVQRAHNLAWNRPTTHNISTDIEGMNAAVDDPAVRSPMDAVAAWWSSLVVHRVLTVSLAEDKESPALARLIHDELDLAARVAPIGSNAQVRALVARAVLVSEKRGTSIANALMALSPSLNPDKHPQYSRGVPPLIDSPLHSIVPDAHVQMALRCAMGIAHLQRYAAPPKQALAILNSVLPLGPAGGSGVSLLACTAVYRLVGALHGHRVAAEACASTLERLAGTLRIWVGSAAGDACGLDREVRHRIVDVCIAVTKSVVGMESDTGYGSMSDCDDDEGSQDTVEDYDNGKSIAV